MSKLYKHEDADKNDRLEQEGKEGKSNQYFVEKHQESREMDTENKKNNHIERPQPLEKK